VQVGNDQLVVRVVAPALHFVRDFVGRVEVFLFIIVQVGHIPLSVVLDNIVVVGTHYTREFQSSQHERGY